MAFAEGMTFNYTLNRHWTFRARGVPHLTSYTAYTAGALGGLLVQLLIMAALARIHYSIGASLGIIGGTLVTYLIAQPWAFAGK